MTTPTRNALTDVTGLRVGHATRTGEGGWLTGTTVVLAPEGGMTAAVDVRGGGPGTKETDALDPRNVVRRIDAVTLTGGSAYGLDAASGVMAWLEEQGRGVRVGAGPCEVVPVVPAACVFDLGRGGEFGARPHAATGRAAVEAAAASAPGSPVAEGSVGAGTGAVIGGLKGGVGTASTVLDSGITVAALVVANAVGSAVDPATGALYGRLFDPASVSSSAFASARNGEPHPHPYPYPSPEAHAAAQERIARAKEEAAGQAPPPMNTTLAVVATDAVLTRSEAHKLAGTSHDGIARAVRPVHLLNDGDTVFAVATGTRPLDEANPLALNDILAAGADMVTRAIVRAVLTADSVRGPGGTFLSYRDLYGS
ncbi:P1 family peptidase [Streptomyces sp. NBC_01445]|uniref:P1 family peptidase n=1 Tax=Streptomyces sp. NBC_01445 TaxID=2903869 RepID=UPI002DD919E7|nr:P1 family peptidase [Streptomyces sp. NBC_01445]WSE06681.1 P1 family peptidase [Streptomyces sp. NBC_01445]